MKKVIFCIISLAILTLNIYPKVFKPTGHIGRTHHNRDSPPPGDMQDILNNPTVEKLATMFTNMSYIDNQRESTRWRQSIVNSRRKQKYFNAQLIFDTIAKALSAIAGEECPECDLRKIQKTLTDAEEKAEAELKPFE